MVELHANRVRSSGRPSPRELAGTQSGEYSFTQSAAARRRVGGGRVISGRRGRAVGGLVVAVCVVAVAGGMLNPTPALPTAVHARTPGGQRSTVPRAESAAAVQGWAQSLAVTMPADLAGLGAAPPCRPLDHAVGWLAREEAKPGDRSWRAALVSGRQTRVVGYLSQPSAVCGDQVSIHLSGSGPVQIKLFRVGWYAGTQARLVWSSAPLLAHERRQSGQSGPTRAIHEAWPADLSVAITSAFEPGLYLAEFVSLVDGSASLAPLTVRDPAGREPLLVQLSAATWAAYNPYGGASLYNGFRFAGPVGTTRGASNATINRSFEATLDRPLTSDGLRELLVRDVPLVHLVERLGSDVGYATDFDVDATPGLLLQHAELVVPGHSEYWSSRMLRGAIAARNSGVNEAWLGANDVYWQMRVSRDAQGRPVGVVCYRSLNDPVAGSDPNLATVKWSSNPGPVVDTGSLVGNRSTGRRFEAGLRLMSAPAWFVAGTGLKVGAVLKDSVANEANGVMTWHGLSPRLQVIAAGGFQRQRSGPVQPVDMTYYSAPSGAAIFAVGTTDWLCEIDGSCPDHRIAPAEAATLRILTVNVLEALRDPAMGRLNPSVPTPRTAPGSIAGLLPPDQIGLAGAQTD